jgi:glutamate formiminotransferase
MVREIIAVPNLSEGRAEARIAEFVATVDAQGATVLDVHSDRDHNRTVLTVAGPDQQLIHAMAELAVVARHIDLRRHRGVHPRLGGLDVCPFVPEGAGMHRAVHVAVAAAKAIATRAELPVYLYGEAAAQRGGRTLPELRRGGLEGLVRRAAEGFVPDFGPRTITLDAGVVCVGARNVLIAFNVWLRCDARAARAIAAAVRDASGGLPGVRALGLPLGEPGVAQVSMNLTTPRLAGIDDAYEAVAATARATGATVIATEIVGLVPERFMPNPQREAARLLIKPGRSLEAARGLS